jgi:DNA polymerase III alpha subunit
MIGSNIDSSRADGRTTSLRTVAEWKDVEALRFEKEVLGFHASGHPLDAHRAALEWMRTHQIGMLETAGEGAAVILGGLLAKVRPTVAKTGRNAGAKMAWLTIADQTGAIECVAFSDVFARYQPIMQQDALVIVIGRVDRRRGEPSVVVDRVLTLEQAMRELAAAIEVTIDLRSASSESAEKILHSLRDRLHTAGDANGQRGVEVVLHLRIASGRTVTLRPSLLRLPANVGVVEGLETVAGNHSVRFRRIDAVSLVTRRAIGIGYANGNGNGNGYGGSPASHQTSAFVNGNADREACASIDRY